MREAWSKGGHAARKTLKPARSMTGGPQPRPLVLQAIRSQIGRKISRKTETDF